MMSLWDFCLKKVLLLTLKTKKRCVWSHYIGCTLWDITAYSFTVQNTPLHAAASKGHQIIVVLLVEHGADVHSNSQYKRVSWDHALLTLYHNHNCLRLCCLESLSLIAPEAIWEDLNSKFSWGGACPHTPLVATHAEACMNMLLHATVILLPSCFPPLPNSKSC